ncbi:MAG: hypothetical protein ACT4NX_02375 [Deltaproteobacteria bacterium]
MRRFALSMAVYFIVIFMLAGGCALAEVSEPPAPQKGSPSETVSDWMKFYGNNMKRAARLTTLDFREGISKELWASYTQERAGLAKYRLLSYQIVQIKEQGDRAQALVKSETESADGALAQTELFLLKRFDGKWLVDDIILKRE